MAMSEIAKINHDNQSSVLCTLYRCPRSLRQRIHLVMNTPSLGSRPSRILVVCGQKTQFSTHTQY